MELPAAGEHVFAVEGIEKKRIRKVTARGERAPQKRAPDVEKYCRLTRASPFSPPLLQGKVEYLVKWRGWPPK